MIARTIAIALLFTVASALHAVEPVVRNLNVRGLQAGGTTTLVLDGDAFGTAPRLLLPFPAKQELKKGATDKQATFAVTLGGDAVAGYYHLWLVTDGGISAPIVIAVDGLPQRPLTAVADPLPTALHGALTGSTTVETRFIGKAGQKVRVEVEAQRLGSKLRPIVHLVTPKRRQLAWGWTTPALHGDARLEAALPEDGTYTVAVHDAEYAGGGPGFFRLRIGEWSSAELIFPPAVARGIARKAELLGPGAPVAVDVPAAAHLGALPLAWPKAGRWSGPRPFVRVSPHAEIVGQAGPGKVQDLPAGAVGVSGRLLAPFAEDRYRIPVAPGSKLRLEVFAERYGAPLDAALVVRNEKGDALARAEDSPGTLDPALDYTVPANVSAIVAGIVDAQGRGGPHAVYRLTVAPAGPAAAPDFRLLTPAPQIALPIGGRWVVPVRIDRRGYDGSVELLVAGLPGSVKLEGATIPAETDGALVTVQRDSAPAQPVVTHWSGRTAGGERPVAVQGSPMMAVQPWLATEIALAPTTAKAADFQVDWSKLPPDAAIVPAKKLLLAVKVVRPAKDAVVRLTLLTSQARPLVNGQLDANQALRLEKPVELAPKANEAELTVLVPPALLAPVYDVTVRAELLAADKKTVLATAFAPVRRMAVQPLLVVKLDGSPRIEAAVSAKTGATVKIAGQIERKEGLTSDVTLTLTGLPPGASAAPVVLKGSATAFAFTVALPANLAAGEVQGLKIIGTAPAGAKQPNALVRSRELALTLVVRTAK